MSDIPDLSIANAVTFVGLLGAGVAWLTQRAFNKRAERRLEVELVLRSVEALEPEHRSAAALFALTELGQMEFALELLRELWGQGALQPGPAIWVIEQGLESADEHLQRQAGMIFADNAVRAIQDTSGTPLIPRQLGQQGWPSEIDRNARLSLLQGCARLAGAVPSPDRALIWPEFMVIARTVLDSDGDELLKRDAGFWLDALISGLGLNVDHSFYGIDDVEWTISEMQKRANEELGRSERAPTTSILRAMDGYWEEELLTRWTGLVLRRSDSDCE